MTIREFLRWAEAASDVQLYTLCTRDPRYQALLYRARRLDEHESEIDADPGAAHEPWHVVEAWRRERQRQATTRMILDEERAQQYGPVPPKPTLGEMNRDGPHWLWACCTNLPAGCVHRAPLPLAPWVIRWGADTPGDRLRAALRCSRCGKRGNVVQIACTGAGETFPVDRMTRWRA